MLRAGKRVKHGREGDHNRPHFSELSLLLVVKHLSGAVFLSCSLYLAWFSWIYLENKTKQTNKQNGI